MGKIDSKLLAFSSKHFSFSSEVILSEQLTISAIALISSLLSARQRFGSSIKIIKRFFLIFLQG